MRLNQRIILKNGKEALLRNGGYIGSSTRSEIEYATATGKVVRYLEPES